MVRTDTCHRLTWEPATLRWTSANQALSGSLLMPFFVQVHSHEDESVVHLIAPTRALTWTLQPLNLKLKFAYQVNDARTGVPRLGRCVYRPLNDIWLDM